MPVLRTRSQVLVARGASRGLSLKGNRKPPKPGWVEHPALCFVSLKVGVDPSLRF